MVFSSKLLNSSSLSGIYSFLKYQRYRQPKTAMVAVKYTTQV